MGEMIGDLDVRTLHAELELRNLDPLARAYWFMTAYSVHPTRFAERFGAERGIVQVLYPGPVAIYERVDGHVAVRIFSNGGNQTQTEELHRRLLADAQQRNIL